MKSEEWSDRYAIVDPKPWAVRWKYLELKETLHFQGERMFESTGILAGFCLEFL